MWKRYHVGKEILVTAKEYVWGEKSWAGGGTARERDDKGTI